MPAALGDADSRGFANRAGGTTPGDELAAALQRHARPLLVFSKGPAPEPKGRVIDESRLDHLVSRLGDELTLTGAKPPWADNRVLYLGWKGSDEEWLLVEDTETTESSRTEAAAKGENR